MGRLGRALVTAFVAGVAFVLGGCGGFVYTLHHAEGAHLVAYYHLPHQVPKYPAGLSFRFAMAHDVIHERYPKHGPAYLRERERLTREKLAKLDRDDRAALSATDDLAVALHRQGHSDEAISLTRDKLARQKRLKIEGKALYTTYANLGTMLMDTNLTAAEAGDAKAKERFREGVELDRKAIEVNPEAHFGREQWQTVYGEFLLAAMDDPTILRKVDLIGDRLDAPISRLLVHEFSEWSEGYGRAYRGDFLGTARWEVTAFFRPDVAPDDPARWAEFLPIRKYVTKAGAERAETEGKEARLPSLREPVAFDEPALGIVGMWRQGGGANPDFALALGEIMLRVGQRYIAWEAFERASRLADQFSPETSTREFLREHCRKRQAEIEQNLRSGDASTNPVPPAEVAELRSKFEAELAFGEEFQRAYQDFEAAKIVAGASIDDDHFYDDFNTDRAPIASPTGPEERCAVVRWGRKLDFATVQGLAIGVLSAGVGAMGVALLLRGVSRAPSPVLPGESGHA